ncbi:MAG: Ig-like domain-containing protein, partial [Angustibacter sp.]
CANFTAGQATASLSWTVPAATTAGRSYARFRASYNTTQAQNPTGQADSGEVEDYTLEIKPAIRVIKDLLPAANPGTFDLSINGTTFATGVGDNGSTGFKSVDDATTSGPTDITVSQNVQTTAIPMTVAEQAAAGTNLGLYTASVACRNAAGALVSSAGAVNIPASVTGATANGQAQTITCTFTNRANLQLADDAGSTLEDTNVAIDVLDNDLGSGGDPMVNSSVKIAAAAAGGFGSTVTVAGQGTYTVNATTGIVTFDPIPGFTGAATPIFYEAGDGTQTDQALIRVTVTPRPPLAVPDTASTPQSISVTKNLLTNDVPGTLALDPASVALLNPATGTYGPSVTIPGEGTYTVDSAGVVTFTPVNSFRGVATPITYRVANTAGTTSPSTLTIT